MLKLFEGIAGPTANHVMRGMFSARKSIFVDLLKWDVPVLAGQFEVDQFDDCHATYLVVTDSAGRHLASARLLPTTRPHILDTLYPELCEDTPPSGPDCFEITRFCLDRSLRAAERRVARNRLINGLVAHALEAGIARYTAIAETGWFQQILAFGWRCRPLGLPRTIGTDMLVALRIEIDAATPADLVAGGIILPEPDAAPALRRAA